MPEGHGMGKVIKVYVRLKMAPLGSFFDVPSLIFWKINKP